MTEQTKGTRSPMNTGAFKRIFSVLVVLLVAATLMVGAVSAEGEGTAADTPLEVFTYDALSTALSPDSAVKYIKLSADIYAESELNVTHAVTIDGSKSDGGKYKIIALLGDDRAWSAGQSDKHLFDVMNLQSGATVVLQNIVFESNTSSAKLDGNGNPLGAYGVQIYDSQGALELINVVLNDSRGSGLTLNGAQGKLQNVVIKNSYWGQSIDVDQGQNVQTEANIISIDSLDGLQDTVQISNQKKNVASVKVGEKDVNPTYAFYKYAKQNTYIHERNVWVATDKCDLVESEFVVKVQNTTDATPVLHYDLAEALSNYVADGATVTLLKALESQSTAFTISKNITFDGQDKQIAFTSTPTGGAIQITATGDVTLQNLNITSTGGSATALINAVEIGSDGAKTAPNSVIIENSKLTVTNAPNGFAVIHAQPATELKVAGSELTATTTEHHVCGIKFNPSHANAKTITVSEKNTIVLESGNTEGTGSAYGVYVLGNTEKLTATISDNTLVAKSKYRVGLLYYTPPKSNEKIIISGNTLSMTGHEVYVQNIMVSKSATSDVTINMLIEGNNAVNTNTTGLLYAIGFAQRADAYDTQYTDSLVGTIAKDNTFTSLTGYVNHITQNVQDGKKIVQLDTSELIIEGQTIDLKIVAPSTSIDLGDTTKTTGQFTVTPEGTAVSWSSSNTDVLTIDANGNYAALKTGSTTIKAIGPSGAEATLLVTVYEEIAPELPVDDIVTTGSTTTIEKGSATADEVKVDTTAGSVTIKDITSGVEMTIKGTTVTEVGGTITVVGTTEISVSYVPEPAAVSPAVAEDESAAGTYETKVSINMVNGTMYLLNTTSEFKEDVVDTIKDKCSDAGKYKFISMFSATGENVTKINANLTETGGVEITFTVPLDWIKKITHNDLTKLKAFHVSNGNVEPLSGTGVVDGTSYKFTVIGNSFSNYVLAADTTAPQNNGGGGSGSSSGSSTWLEPTQQPTEIPTEQPTDKPTDTVPTDIPSTQPTATPSTPGFGVLAVIAGLGAVAVLRRQ